MLLARSIIVLFALSFSIAGYGQLHWVKKQNFPAEARHRSSAFSIGEKGYVGGGHINSGVTKTYVDWWEYDPASDSWTQIADYGGGARYYMATFTIDGAGYAGGGEDHYSNYRSDYWKYEPSVNTWFPLADLPGLPRRGSTSFVIDGIPYVGMGQSGGPDNGGYELDFYLYDKDGDDWYPIADFIGTARTGAVGFANGGKGYVGTGHMVGAATKDFFEYNPTTDTWLQLADVDTTLRQDATGFALDGKGYILTGNDVLGTVDYKDMWEYDFAADTWTLASEFPASSRRFMVNFIIGSKAYCHGGTNGTNLKDLWMFDPSYDAIEENEEIQIEIYPNPTTDYLQIQTDLFSSGLSVLEYSIHDLGGKEISNGVISDENKTIDCRDYDSGNYILSLTDNDRVLLTEQFILK